MVENKRAFTLIELLVVILIIGVLAAVALPQYQKSVLKSHTVEAMVTLNAVEQAQKVYYLEHGTYTDDPSLLDIQTTVPFWAYRTNWANIRITPNLSLEWVWSSSPVQHRCIASNEQAHAVCQSLGGVPMDHPSNNENLQYYLLP